MVILTAQQLSKGFGDRTLFDDVSFGISSEDKIGIIGANGTGKSTLLNIIIGHMEPDSGEVATNRQAHIELLSQRPDLDDEATALAAVLEDGPEAFQVLKNYERACHQLELSPEDTQAMTRVTKLADEMDRVDGWSVEGEARSLLGALGIEDLRQVVSEMSGGQRKRLALARALLRPSDLLILDEPTNHLDVATIEWLETYLGSRQGALLLITHDRYFLDRVVSRILEFDVDGVYSYQGNYSVYTEKKLERMELRQRTEDKRLKLLKRELAWLRRTPAARTGKSRARVNRAEDLRDNRGPQEDSHLQLDF